MPRHEENMQRHLDRFKRMLEAKIAERRTDGEWLDSDAERGADVAFQASLPVQIDGSLIDSKFAVHADCICIVAADFIDRATIRNLTLGEGPRGGQRVAIDGACPTGLNIYWDP